MGRYRTPSALNFRTIATGSTKSSSPWDFILPEGFKVGDCLPVRFEDFDFSRRGQRGEPLDVLFHRSFPRRQRFCLHAHIIPDCGLELASAGVASSSSWTPHPKPQMIIRSGSSSGQHTPKQGLSYAWRYGDGYILKTTKEGSETAIVCTGSTNDSYAPTSTS